MRYAFSCSWNRRAAVAVLVAWASCAGVCAAVDFDPGGMTVLKLLPQEARAAKPDDIAIAVWPAELLDAERTHYLNQDTPTTLIFALANPRARELQKAWVTFDLPEDVDLLFMNSYLPWHLRETSTVERDGQPYTRVDVGCSAHPTTFPRGRGRGAWFHRYRPPTLWLRSDREPGSSLGKIYYRVRYQEEGSETVAESPESWVHLAVLPKIEAQQPKLAKSGVMGRFILNFPYRSAPESPGIFTGYAKQLGYNYYMNGPPMTNAPAGMGRWVEGRIHNGFDIRTGEEIPEEIRYVAHEKEFPRAVSPWAIYRRHPWVVSNLFRRVQQEIREGQYTGVWSNWEPYAMMANGDYSEGSLREFVKWSGLPDKDVREGWPLDAVERYAKQWKAFRNWELGEIVRLMIEVVKEADPEATFAVGMSNDSIWAGIEDHGCSARDWGDMDYILQTWSYYFVANSEGPYPVSDRCGAPAVIRSGAVSRHLDRRFGTDRKVKLSCICGWEQTGGGGFFLPEQLAFLHLSPVLAGMANTQNYAEWPVWDGRYALAIAEANTRIARWEEYILTGEKKRTHVVIPVSPYPQEVRADVTPDDQEMKGGWAQPVYLVSFEYRRDDRRLITVANTWDYADVFFRIRFPAMTGQGTFLLSEPEKNRCFTNAEGDPALSADDLAAGVLAHLGATRWGAFVLEPYDEEHAAGLEKITPERVQEEVSDPQRQAAWAEAVERDFRLYTQDFQSAEPGPHRVEKHGGAIIDDTFGVGLPLRPEQNENMQMEVVDVAGDRLLRVVDREAANGFFLDLKLSPAAGEVFFDFQIAEPAPLDIYLGAAAVLTIPDEAHWQSWFGTPYRPHLVVLAGKGEGRGSLNDPGSFTPIDTGFAPEPGKRYRLVLSWEDRRLSVTADGRIVARDVPFLAPDLPATPLRWSTVPAREKPCVFLIDNIKVMKKP